MLLVRELLLLQTEQFLERKAVPADPFLHSVSRQLLCFSFMLVQHLTSSFVTSRIEIFARCSFLCTVKLFSGNSSLDLRPSLTSTETASPSSRFLSDTIDSETANLGIF